jgi:nucleoside-diphosphate-sugar epimerase
MIFVTGSTGFIGSQFIMDCLRKRIKVKALVRNVRKAEILFGKPNDNLEFVEGDLLNPESYKKELNDCTAVVHAGAKVGYWGNREEFLLTNALSTVRLAYYVKKTGIRRFIYLSSQAAVRTIKWNPLNKINKYAPHTDYPSEKEFGRYYYGLSKKLAEKSLLTLNDDNFRVIILRPHIVWGAGDTTFSFMLTRLSRKPGFMMVAGKNINCASSHIDTVIHYIHRALQCNGEAGHIFHILDDSKMTVNDWIEGLLTSLRLRKPKLSIPYNLAYMLGFVSELISRVIRKIKSDFYPRLDRFIVDGLGREMKGDMSQTIKVLGRPPLLDINKARGNVAEWYSQKGRYLERSGLFDHH